MDHVREQEEGGGPLAVRWTRRVDGSGVSMPLPLPSGRAGEKPAAVMRLSAVGTKKIPFCVLLHPPSIVTPSVGSGRGRFCFPSDPRTTTFSTDPDSIESLERIPFHGPGSFSPA
eukprot:scaffold610_cov352-Pavlova_lutheri.AAC.3